MSKKFSYELDLASQSVILKMDLDEDGKAGLELKVSAELIQEIASQIKKPE